MPHDKVLIPQISNGSTGRINQTNLVHTIASRLSGDTGERDVSGQLTNGWFLSSGGKFTVERVGDRVTWRWRGLHGSAASTVTAILFGNEASGKVSSNFAPDSAQRSGVYKDANGDDYYLGFIANGAQGDSLYVSPVGIPTTHENQQGEWSYHTHRAWPSFLPPAV